MGKADKGKSYLDGRWSIVKEGVKVRGIPSGFWCNFDMQDAIVDGEAHKDDPCRRVLVKVRAPGEVKRRYRGRNQLQ